MSSVFESGCCALRVASCELHKFAVRVGVGVASLRLKAAIFDLRNGSSSFPSVLAENEAIGFCNLLFFTRLGDWPCTQPPLWRVGFFFQGFLPRNG